jgi:hypothetical protein
MTPGSMRELGARGRRPAAVFVATIAFTPAFAADAGMFLCRSPVIASGVWG